MRPEDRVRVQHLIDAATKAIVYSSDRRRSDLNDDELLRLGLTKLVEIVGEAAKCVSDEGAHRPSRHRIDRRRMRDRLIHHYYR